MKRLIYIVACIATLLVGSVGIANGAGAKDRSTQIVHIEGVRYYVHEVQKSNTLYSLSKLYGVSEELILSSNSNINDGLKIGMSIKIPVVVDVKEEAQSAKKVQRKKFDEHLIKEGETLYAIARRYEVSVAIILEDNPTLDPTDIAIGTVINIRKSEQGLTDESTTKSELNEYRELLNSVVPKGYTYHLVSEDDTIISLAEISDMSVEELRRINKMDGDEELVVGNMVLVRDLDLNLRLGVDSNLALSDSLIYLMEPSFDALSMDDTLKVALMLPLQMRGYNMKPFAEFYQGFLLGVEDLQAEGYNIVINLYNTQRDQERVAQIIQSEEYAECNLIVGPVYEELLAEVLEDAESRNVPVVSPLVNIETSDSPVLFQMAPERSNRYDKIGALISKERTITLIYGQKNDTEYVEEIKAMLEEAELEYDEHNYKYEHTSVVSDRNKELEERIEKIEEAAIASYRFPDQRLIDSLRLKMISPSDLRPVMANEADYNTFFIMSDSETEVDRILSSMVSASSSRYTKLVPSMIDSTMLVSISVRPSKYEVVANPDWRHYKNIDHTIYFNNRVVTFSSYLAGRESEAIRDFDSRYSKAYEDMPSLYAYRGYDVIKIFGESLYSKIRYGLMNESFTPLQTEYRFEVVDSLSTRRVNKNWIRVNYQPNLKLNIE